MPRSLIKHAVHPSYPVANAPHVPKWRRYTLVVVVIIIFILFCDTLFHSNDPKARTTESIPQILSLPLRLPSNDIERHFEQQLSDSLEELLRPRVHSHSIISPHHTQQAKQLDIDHQSMANALLLDTKQTAPNLTYSDYWDFPLRSHSKPTATSSVRHRGEYEMHQARVKWFQKEYIEKHKAIAPASNLIVNFTSRCPVYQDNKHCKWTPPKHELCNWTNTAIFWHSMHGTMVGGDFRLKLPGDHWIWDFALELQASKTCSCPSNVAFVFADNREKKVEERLVQRSYLHCNENCHFYHVAQDYHPWDWFGKIGPLLQLIETAEFQAKYEYVVLTDADDQTLVQSPMDIVERFEFYNASIVVGGEATSYPNWQNQEKSFENAVYPWSRHHQHLNAGGFMGKIVDMIPYLKYMKDDYETFTVERAEEIAEKGRNFWRDQTVWRQMHVKFYPDIKIDSLAKIWTRTDLFMYDL